MSYCSGTGVFTPRGDAISGVPGVDVDDCCLAASEAMVFVGSTSCAAKLKS